MGHPKRRGFFAAAAVGVRSFLLLSTARDAGNPPLGRLIHQLGLARAVHSASSRGGWHLGAPRRGDSPLFPARSRQRSSACRCRGSSALRLILPHRAAAHSAQAPSTSHGLASPTAPNAVQGLSPTRHGGGGLWRRRGILGGVSSRFRYSRPHRSSANVHGGRCGHRAVASLTSCWPRRWASSSWSRSCGSTDQRTTCNTGLGGADRESFTPRLRYAGRGCGLPLGRSSRAAGTAAALICCIDRQSTQIATHRVGVVTLIGPPAPRPVRARSHSISKAPPRPARAVVSEGAIGGAVVAGRESKPSPLTLTWSVRPPSIT